MQKSSPSRCRCVIWRSDDDAGIAACDPRGVHANATPPAYLDIEQDDDALFLVSRGAADAEAAAATGHARANGARRT
jgi:hypothetical protein